MPTTLLSRKGRKHVQNSTHSPDGHPVVKKLELDVYDVIRAELQYNELSHYKVHPEVARQLDNSDVQAYRCPRLPGELVARGFDLASGNVPWT